VEILDPLAEPDRLLRGPYAVRVEAKAVAGQRGRERAIALELVRGRKHAALQLVRLEPVRSLELTCVIDELVARPNFTVARLRVCISKKQIRRERHTVAHLAAQNVVNRDAPLLSENVETRELQRRQNLGAVVVERRGGVGDEESHLLEPRRIAADQVRLETLNGLDGALTAATHLTEADNPVVGLDFYDGANEATPVAPVCMPERRFERHGDGRGADVGDLHRDTAR